MLIDLRLDGQTEGVEGATTAAAALLRASAEGRLDAATTRVVGDWVQYRHSFRAPLSLRVIEGAAGPTRREVACDLRRIDEVDFEGGLDGLLAGTPGTSLHLEAWTPLASSCIWAFNALYWRELALWEQADGRGYAQALPGGESGGTNEEATSAVIEALFEIWDGLTAKRALPDQLTVLELGVGNGEQARVWLDTFCAMDAARGTEYYRRLQYLMGDSSTHVLARARETVAAHKARVSTLVLDAARPTETLRFLEGKIFFVYISNVYDNLPTDEIAVLADTFYRLECRAYLEPVDTHRLATRFSLEESTLPELADRLVRLAPALLAEAYPDSFACVASAVSFWQELWEALRLEERYVPLGPLDLYEVCDDVTGELFASLVDGHGDVRFHVSNGALASFADTLPLLHPLGWLTCHDLFVTDLCEYGRAYKGPGKYDGSVVNWVNGPLLQAVGARLGFHVRFSPFAAGSRSPLVTASARARE